MSAEEKKTQEAAAAPAATATATTATAPAPAKVKGGGTAVKEKPTETSMLGKRLLELWHRVKQGESRLTWYILGGVAAIVIGIFVWKYFAGLARGRDSARNAALLVLEDRVATTDLDVPQPGPDGRPIRVPAAESEKQIKVLEDFIKENEGKSQARYARFALARLLMNHGLQGLRAGGMQGGPNPRRADIQKAAETYEKLIPDSGDVPLLLGEALFNAGKCRETLGEFDEARKHYDRLTSEKELKDTFWGKEADAQKKRLDNPEEFKRIKALADQLNR
jgi:hypothetical protein